jgi:pyruvate dehydrogenase E2 component (dihydrolipoamide acetyltransferase)
MTVLRKRIAENMAKSHQTAAKVGLTVEVDAGQLLAKKNQLESNGTKVGFNVIIAKVVALALAEHPALMAQLKDDEIVHPSACNIGIAVDTPAGLVVPVLKNVPGQSMAALQQQLEGMAGRASAGKSTTDDLDGGVFTITNLGGFEIDSFYPMIRLPECAILAFGAIVRKPVVIAEAIAIRSRMSLTLAFDHRLVDGAPAARFLQKVKHLLEELPENL